MSFTLITTAEGLTLGRFGHLSVPHAVAGRTGGLSTGPYTSLNLGPRSGDDPALVRRNRDRFLAATALAGRRPIAPRQVHSADVAVHRAGAPLPDPAVFDGDGIVTDDPAVVLMLLAADCATLLLHDSVKQVVAALHAGWRGTAGTIAVAGVRRMAETFGSDPSHLRAGIGPAIGRCCYEVGPDVAAAVAHATPPDADIIDEHPHANPHLDLVAANRAQLLAVGLRPDHIAAAGLCTACRTDLFFSHRHEGEPTGRFGAAIALH